ncbi:MAG: hypothetical protein M0P16_03440 [Syntrophales bacterium]|jgi:hypothetical protein|nr:hypothetical protein [Syntrophales bacterium]
MNTSFKGNFTRIKDLSDKRRLPRLGKIRLGVKAVSAKGGKEYPREVNYFVVPPEVEKVYGDKPTELDVMFPLNDIESVFPQSYKWYGGSRGLKCIGNGECAMRLDEKTQSMRERPCPCELLEQGVCQRRAHLMVMLPKVSMGGIYQFDMGSYHSIIDINSGLDFVQALVGRFAMVPLKLRRVPRETNANGKKTIHYPLQIVLTDADVESVNGLRDDNRRVLTAASRLALAPPEDCNPQFDDAATVVVEDDAIPAIPYGNNSSVSMKETDAAQPAAAPDFVTEPESSQALAQTPPLKAPNPESPGQAQPQPPKGGIPSEKGEVLANVAQQSAILKLAAKAGIEEAVVLQKMRGMTMAVAAGAIVSLQRGDTTIFSLKAAA